MKKLIPRIGGKFLRLILLLAALAALRLAAATNDTAEATLRRAVDEFLGAAYPAEPAAGSAPLPARLRPLLERYFDFESLTRRAVGPGWRDFSADDRRRAVELFTTLVVRVYAGRFSDGARPQIRYVPAIAVAADLVEAPSQVIYDGKTYAVDYRLERLPEGWRIYDVLIEGVSFVANYRAQFAPLVQQSGAAGLLRALELKLRENVAAKS
jgi:phospholipid transport system substrate-binding protein